MSTIETLRLHLDPTWKRLVRAMVDQDDDATRMLSDSLRSRYGLNNATLLACFRSHVGEYYGHGAHRHTLPLTFEETVAWLETL